MHSPTEAAALGAAPADSAIWNPLLIAFWSVVFTPAFGAYLLMRNWETLGEPRQAAVARKWFCFGLGLLTVDLLSAAINARLNSESNLMRWTGLLFLLAWCLAAALPQVLLVRSRFGAGYVRKTWEPALLGAVLLGALYYGTRACFTYLLLSAT